VFQPDLLLFQSILSHSTLFLCMTWSKKGEDSNRLLKRSSQSNLVIIS